jgi:hypothetical protein
VVPCGLALATSKPSGQHDTGPGYSRCWLFLLRLCRAYTAQEDGGQVVGTGLTGPAGQHHHLARLLLLLRGEIVDRLQAELLVDGEQVHIQHQQMPLAVS